MNSPASQPNNAAKRPSEQPLFEQVREIVQDAISKAVGRVLTIYPEAVKPAFTDLMPALTDAVLRPLANLCIPPPKDAADATEQQNLIATREAVTAVFNHLSNAGVSAELLTDPAMNLFSKELYKLLGTLNSMADKARWTRVKSAVETGEIYELFQGEIEAKHVHEMAAIAGWHGVERDNFISALFLRDDYRAAIVTGDECIASTTYSSCAYGRGVASYEKIRGEIHNLAEQGLLRFRTPVELAGDSIKKHLGENVSPPLLGTQINIVPIFYGEAYLGAHVYFWAAVDKYTLTPVSRKNIQLIADAFAKGLAHIVRVERSSGDMHQT